MTCPTRNLRDHITIAQILLCWSTHKMKWPIFASLISNNFYKVTHKSAISEISSSDNWLPWAPTLKLAMPQLWASTCTYYIILNGALELGCNFLRRSSHRDFHNTYQSGGVRFVWMIATPHPHPFLKNNNWDSIHTYTCREHNGRVGHNCASLVDTCTYGSASSVWLLYSMESTHYHTIVHSWSLPCVYTHPLHCRDQIALCNIAWV